MLTCTVLTQVVEKPDQAQCGNTSLQDRLLPDIRNNKSVQVCYWVGMCRILLIKTTFTSESRNKSGGVSKTPDSVILEDKAKSLADLLV